MELLDTVRLLRAVPEYGLKVGAQGVVVEIFDEPNRAFEVEFTDSNGETVAELALTPDDIAPVK